MYVAQCANSVLRWRTGGEVEGDVMREGSAVIAETDEGTGDVLNFGAQKYQ